MIRAPLFSTTSTRAASYGSIDVTNSRLGTPSPTATSPHAASSNSSFRYQASGIPQQILEHRKLLGAQRGIQLMAGQCLINTIEAIIAERIDPSHVWLSGLLFPCDTRLQVKASGSNHKTNFGRTSPAATQCPGADQVPGDGCDSS
jgi:hypothetical protein